MKRLPLGTLLGGLIGLPAGVFGVGFGLLVGTLVDQAVQRGRERRSLVRLVEHPLGDGALQALPVETAILVLSLVIDGELSSDRRALVLQRLSELYQPPRRRAAELARIAGEAASLALHADSAGLTEFLRRKLPLHEREAVVDLLLAVGVEPVRVRRIAERWDIPGERYRALRDPYRVLDPQACALLGVSPAAGPDEVKRVYRALAVQFHPDAAGGLDEAQRMQAEQAYLRVQAAYHTIMREFEN